MTASPVMISAAAERQAIVETLVRRGATLADAGTQADMLVEGDLRAQPSHGLRRLPVLVGRLERGLAVSGVEPVLDWRTPGALSVDGRRGFGPVVTHRALDAIIPRAHELGIATAAIRSAGHVGMLAPYVERMAAEGCVGIALTVSEALVHAWGGSRTIVGTNPIGIGVPTTGEPLVLDMSTASVSAGKILDYAARDEPIPPGWAVDENGEPTTDATAASRGAISPFGGPKGYALGLAFESVVGLLAGSAYGREVFGTLDTEHPPSKGDLLIAISVRAFGALGGLGALTDYLDAVRFEGDGAVTVPGDRARAERARRLREGVPVDRALWETVARLRTTGGGPAERTPE